MSAMLECAGRPPSITGAKRSGDVLAPKGTDPSAYAVRCDVNCMSPIKLDGDTVVISPAMKVRPGMIVALFGKRGGTPAIKRLVTLPLHEFAPGSEVKYPLIVEINNPPKRSFVQPSRIEAIQAIIGVVRDGQYAALCDPQDAG